MATGLGARWFAAYVEQPQTAMLPEAARSRAADDLRLAADLGAETVTLTGGDVAEEIGRFAQQQRITRIIVGKPGPSRGTSIFARNPVDQLVRISGDVDVYVIAGEPGAREEASYVIRPRGFGWPTMAGVSSTSSSPPSSASPCTPTSTSAISSWCTCSGWS